MAVDIHQPATAGSTVVSIEKDIPMAPSWIWVILPIIVVFAGSWISFLMYMAVARQIPVALSILAALGLFVAGLFTNPQSIIRRIG